MRNLARKSPHQWGDIEIGPGEAREVRLNVSESYSGLTIPIPVYVRRGPEDGPTVFVSAALHGDEINGTGAIRLLIADRAPQLVRGTIIFVPVVNILGFDRHSRYLPDRRDLNRCFPGNATGSVASRMARLIFDEIVGRSDYGVDLHTAAVRRTNYPNVRADMTRPEVRRLAEAFGCEVILAGRGPEGALRREACQVGCPTIILEAGEVWKVEPAIVECAVRGVHNVLARLGMTDDQPVLPSGRIIVHRSRWVRAERGGFLEFHARPGEVVRAGQPLATNRDLVGNEVGYLSSPMDAIVLGMTTLPAIGPGDPIYHLGELTEGSRSADHLESGLAGIHEQVTGDLATNILVVEREPSDPDQGERLGSSQDG